METAFGWMMLSLRLLVRGELNMAWQPLYGTCWDDVVGNGHTSSLRGKVGSVGLACATNYGMCVEVSVGYTDGKERVDKPDLRKVRKELRDKAEKEYEENVDNETKISVSISLKEDNHFNYSIDGVEIDRKILKLLRSDKSKDFLMVVDRLLKSVEGDKQ